MQRHLYIFLTFLALATAHTLQAGTTLPDILLYENQPGVRYYTQAGMLVQPVHLPKDAIHPLRAIRPPGCDNGMSYNHDGIEENGIIDPELEAAVCSLLAAIPAPQKDSFSVFDYGMYPPLTFVNRGEAHDIAFQCMIDKVENEFHPPYYLLMGKQVNPEDGSVTFRMALHLPKSGTLSNLNSTIEEMFSKMVLQAIESKHEDLNSLSLLPTCEVAGINKLKELIQLLLNGGFAEFNDDFLFLNDFFPVKGDVSTVDNLGTPLSGNGIYDFAGLRIDEGQGLHLVRDNISQALQAINFSSIVIITRDENYDSGDNNDFQEASEIFDAATQKIVYWFHYYTPPANASNTTPKAFLKLKNNFTSAEAETIIQDYFNEFLALHAGTGGAARAENLVECPQYPALNLAAIDWRTNGNDGQNLLNCIDSYSIGGLALFNEYQGGLVCGMFDGMLDCIGLLSAIAEGLYDLTAYAHTQIPDWLMPLIAASGPIGMLFTLMPMIDVMVLAVRKEVLEKGWVKILDWDIDQKDIEESVEKHMTNSVSFWAAVYSIYDEITKDGNALRVIFEGIKTQFSTWFDSAIGNNGMKAMAYAHGKLIFEILLEIATTGSSTVLTGVKVLTLSAKKNIGKLLTGLSNQNFSGYLAGAWNALDPVKAIRCTILGRGCFIIGTQVWTGSGLVRIEQLQPQLTPAININFLNSFARQTISITNKN